MGRPSKYPAEFRQEAVRLALVSDESRAAVARRLGINETTLRNWVADHVAEEARGSDPLAIAVSEREELRQLRKENAELRTSAGRGTGPRCARRATTARTASECASPAIAFRPASRSSRRAPRVPATEGFKSEPRARRRLCRAI